AWRTTAVPPRLSLFSTGRPCAASACRMSSPSTNCSVKFLEPTRIGVCARAAKGPAAKSNMTRPTASRDRRRSNGISLPRRKCGKSRPADGHTIPFRRPNTGPQRKIRMVQREPNGEPRGSSIRFLDRGCQPKESDGFRHDIRHPSSQGTLSQRRSNQKFPIPKGAGDPPMRRHSIAVLPGDGIGKEVTPAAMRVLQAAARRYGFVLDETTYMWNCDYYLEHGRMMPPDGLEQLRRHDAIFLGAIGNPAKVPDHIALRESLLLWRQAFDLYINLRPVKLLPGIPGPLRERPGLKVDMVFVRENSEGEYAGVGGRLRRGTPDEVAIQTTIFTRKGVERVMRYAFETARKRPAKKLACATKSNAIQYTMVFWDEVCRELAKEYPDVQVSFYHIDALAARMVTHPETLDVVVTSNLFGDILTDLGGALQGSLGIPASGNIDPERRNPSLFEPVHGSAPDIAGK